MFLLHGRSWLKLLSPFSASTMLKSAGTRIARVVYNKRVLDWGLLTLTAFGFFTIFIYVLDKMGMLGLPYLETIIYAVHVLRMSRITLPYLMLVVLTLHFILRENLPKNFLFLKKKYLLIIFSFILCMVFLSRSNK